MSQRFLPFCRFIQVLLDQFDIPTDEHLDFLLQIYDSIINEFFTFDDERHVFDVTEEFDDLRRFRLIRRSKLIESISKENLHLTLTMGKLDHAAENIRYIQSCSIGIFFDHFLLFQHYFRFDREFKSKL